jgi:crotonobetainyl-CoA:carnitine CoA-transferase CaiB-like acyl-CoA transferase
MTDTNAELPALGGIRVVEIANDPAGEMVGKLMAQLGATVMKIEPPEGAPSRRVGPFAHNRAAPNPSLNFTHYNLGKQSAVLDLTEQQRHAQLAALLTDADVLLLAMTPHDAAQAGLDPDALAAAHDRLVVAWITPFGPDGPWANRLTSDLVGLALGGPLHTCGYDDHSLPPIRPGGNQGYQSAATFAAIGIALALIDRDKTGRGQRLDVPMHECLAVNTELAVPYWIYPRVVVRRQTCRHAQPSPTAPALFPTADGRFVYIVLVLADKKPWDLVVSWLAEAGMAVDLQDDRFSDPQYRQDNFSYIQNILECFFLVKNADEAYHEGQARGLPIGVLRSPEELYEDEHLASRDFFEEIDDGTGTHPHARSPIRIAGSAARPQRPAPPLGAHTAELPGRASTGVRSDV